MYNMVNWVEQAYETKIYFLKKGLISWKKLLDYEAKPQVNLRLCFII